LSLEYASASIGTESIDAANADLQCNIGLALSELGSVEASVAHYRAAITLNPKNATAHNNLAVELFQIGLHTEALRHATIAAEMSGDPDYERNRLLFVSS
jgi:tetratricopeptide (TPR) repeat protein